MALMIQSFLDDAVRLMFFALLIAVAALAGALQPDVLSEEDAQSEDVSPEGQPAKTRC